jgi:hypothetical protein
VALQQGFALGEMGSMISLRCKSPEPLMSALGQKQTSRHLQPMSALPPKADIAQALIDRSLFTHFDTAIRTVQVLLAIVGPRLTELQAEGGI